MNNNLRNDAIIIADYAINKVMPNTSVRDALRFFNRPIGKTVMISIGKAAYLMAKEVLNHIKIDKGLIITKYKHAKETLDNTEVIEAGHPILDENSLKAGKKAIEMVKDLQAEDTLLFLVSGGGSALFEDSELSLDELKDVNDQLIKSGANINEINTIRKRLSKIKGGKLAKLAYPAKVFNIVLSDIINDPLDLIASGPTINDNTTSKEALAIFDKYNLSLSAKAKELLNYDGIKNLNNIESYVAGNNTVLTMSAKQKALELGYEVVYIEKPFVENIEEVKEILLKKYQENKGKEKVAIISGGEITVKVKGNGLGGRNQALALTIGKGLEDNSAVLCIGSDGSDGPTDAAGAYIEKGMIDDTIDQYLQNDDSYHYCEKVGGLIKTGPTGTNVCDLYMILINNS